MAVQLYSNFAADALTALLASDTSISTQYTRLCIGYADETEVTVGDYENVPTTEANWSSSGGVATNSAAVYFPINDTNTSYTASHFMIRRRVYTRNNTENPIVYSHPFELGSLTVGNQARVKIHKYIAGKHRGVYIRMAVTA